MAMSDARVLDAMQDGRIIIDPFVPECLSTSSYDIHLGEYFYREQHPRFSRNIFNMYDPDHVKKVWGEAEHAPFARDVIDMPMHMIKPDDRVILIEPGETILAHTSEFIGGRHSITTMMKARSSTGRCFVSVCHDAGWGDVGYINRWALEVTNKSRHYAIPLLVGSRIGQIVFLETGPIRDKDYSDKGAYQSSNDLDAVKAAWKPENMLPRNRP